jgi:hypothetical protein
VIWRMWRSAVFFDFSGSNSHIFELSDRASPRLFLVDELLPVVQFENNTICGGLLFSRASRFSSSLTINRIAHSSFASIAA